MDAWIDNLTSIVAQKGDPQQAARASLDRRGNAVRRAAAG
jgi:hypothetical protein